MRPCGSREVAAAAAATLEKSEKIRPSSAHQQKNTSCLLGREGKWLVCPLTQGLFFVFCFLLGWSPLKKTNKKINSSLSSQHITVLNKTTTTTTKSSNSSWNSTEPWTEWRPEREHNSDENDMRATQRVFVWIILSEKITNCLRLIISDSPAGDGEAAA